MTAPDIALEEHVIADIAEEIDLRDPNADALTTLAGRLSMWQQSGQTAGAEFVFDLATGVGKTWLMVGAINYLARFGVRNFVVFVPRVAILRKTIDNLTPGHRKSVVNALPFDVTVITADDLDTPATAAAMDDPEQVKVYVVTVQTFIGRESDVQRRAHSFREELGDDFYNKLQEMDDLVIFADEHHTYYGDAFSKAIRDLIPMCLVGLTATPHSKTPADQIVYRYPLANAIEDRHVKRPVIVGRSDELTDERTKLHDGVTLLRIKQDAADAYADSSGAGRRNLLMLVVTEDITEAKRTEELLTDDDFFGGEYADRVLRVDSSQPEEALEALNLIEEETSPFRIVVSVAMLKEGWDVATVAVICSLRPSVSDILTEQTLGRGLRLPWGRWVANPLLNELDVIAHDKYEKVLAHAGVLVEARINWETWTAEQEHAAGELAAAAASEQAKQAIRETVGLMARRVTGPATPPAADTDLELAAEQPGDWATSVRDIEGRIDEATKIAASSSDILEPHLSRGSVRIPVVRVEERPDASYSLEDVWVSDPQAFRQLGEQIARDPEELLRRLAVEAVTTVDSDGIPVTRIRTMKAQTAVKSQATPPPLPEVKSRLARAVLSSNYASGTLEETTVADAMVNAVVQGAGDKADTLGAYLDQVAGALVRTIGGLVSSLQPKVVRTETVTFQPIDWRRPRATETIDDLHGPEFVKGGAYVGWEKHLYDQATFHSDPERRVAVSVDEADGIECWVRLQNGDLPVSWLGDDRVRNYNPDLLVVEDAVDSDDGPVRHCWLVEVKADTRDEDDEVKAKHRAASQWAARVNLRTTDEVWNVLRVNETHISQARGSWKALKQLGHRAYAR